MQSTPGPVSALIDGALAPFLDGSFFGIAIAISVVMAATAKSLRKLKPGLIQQPKVGFAMTWLNVVLGVLAAIPSTYLTGGSFLARMPFGIVAGGLSHAVYKLILKRLEFFGGKKDAPPTPPEQQGD